MKTKNKGQESGVRGQRSEVRDQRSEVKGQRSGIRVFCFLFSIFYLLSSVFCYARESSGYVNEAWSHLGKREFTETNSVVDECIEKYSSLADDQAKILTSFPTKGEEKNYKIMNDVATCYFIKGEALMREGKTEQAKTTFTEVINKYPYSQSFDPRGWYWSIKEKSKITLKKLETGRVEEETEEEEIVISKIKLYDQGKEFPVDYARYGEFKNIGEENYKYVIINPVELAKATGEGIYPNSTSVKFDPEFVKIKKTLFKIDHWKIANSRDLSTAFYKWHITPESEAIKQFIRAELLERSGLIKHAIKSYYAILVHFPRSYSWTYWHTPWYVGKAALYRIKYLLYHNPKLDIVLEGGEIKIINGYDNDIRNDIFLVDPGKLRSLTFWEKKFSFNKYSKKRKLLKKTFETNGKKVKLVKYDSGDWQLFVDGKPFMLKGMTYGPTRVGESPDDGSMQNWTTQDLNNNSIIDSPYESWVDKNQDNQQNKGEIAVGDFQLMKEMGVNSLRLYHQPFKLNKKMLGQMHQKYGIYILIGDFLGKYALGSNADWKEGTDYDNPEHQKNMLESVKKMVQEFKNEPYVLIWLLGNENVYGLGCNADEKPESFFKFANKAAQLIKSLDPQKRPVAIVSGDVLHLDIFAKNCPDIDIFGANCYRGKYGFLDFWDEVKRVTDKPAMIAEYGTSSYAKGYSKEESEDYQAQYHKDCWTDILCNASGFGAGNALGSFVFEWIDEWWKAYEPTYHDKKGVASGPFLDGYYHEEWFGVCGQGDGMNSPYLRKLKPAYFTYKELWN